MYRHTPTAIKGTKNYITININIKQFSSNCSTLFNNNALFKPEKLDMTCS